MGIEEGMKSEERRGRRSRRGGDEGRVLREDGWRTEKGRAQ